MIRSQLARTAAPVAAVCLALAVSAGSLTAAATAPSPGGGVGAVLGDTLPRGGTLLDGDSLVSSSGRFSLFVGRSEGSSIGMVLEERGNPFSPHPYARFYRGGGFSSDQRVTLQHDGNLVYYGSSNVVLFSSNTAGSGADRLVMQDDGNLVLYAGNTAVFQTDTARPSRLHQYGSLLPGERLESPDGGTTLVMQTDGNLVLYTRGVVRFATNTFVPGAGAVFQFDHNFVVYSPAGQALFSTGTSSRFISGSVLVEDRQFGVVDERGALSTSHYSSSWTSSTLESGMRMVPGDRRTAIGNVLLLFQADGNLVLYQNEIPRYASGTLSPNNAIMQGDGNFVLYLVTDGIPEHPAIISPVRWTGTWGHPGSRLVIQSDANLVIYTPDNRPLFATLQCNNDDPRVSFNCRSDGA